MSLSHYWSLTVIPLLLIVSGGCNDSSTASPSGGKSPTDLIESGNAALASSDFAGALDDFNGAVDAQPESARAREGRAATYLQMKKFEQAVNDCDAALKLDGKLAAVYFTRGLAERGLGNTEKGIEDFGKALDNGRERVDVLTARGALYHGLAKAQANLNPDSAATNLGKALGDFDRAIKLDPRDAGMHVERASIHMDMDNYEGAVADCDAALAADPKMAAAHVVRARGECELSEFDKAIVDCDAAIHLDGQLVEAYVFRAKARLEQASEMRTLAEVADCRKAAADCRQAIELAKNFKGDAEAMKRVKSLSALAHELRGSIYQGLPATKKALAEYEEALSLDPYLVSALLRRAVARSADADFAAALNDCNMAVSIDGARPEVYNGRATVYALKPDYPKAIEDFTQAVSLNRKYAKAYAGRALVYSVMAMQEFSRASELAKAKRTADKPEIAACTEKGNEYRQKSIDDATAAIAANRHLARAYLTRGMAYNTLKRPQEALDDYTAAIREDSKMVKAYFQRGVLLAKQPESRFWDAAINDFEEARNLEPKGTEPDHYLYLIYRKKNDPIMTPKYFKSWQEKVQNARNDQANLFDPTAEITVKPKAEPVLQPDVEVDPLVQAKRDLEKDLDATVAQEK